MKMKRLFACLAVMVLLAAALPLSALADYATVNSTDVLYLRSQPSTDGAVLGKYRRGTRVEILYTGYRNWTRVLTPDGKVGYMYKKYLSTGGKSSGGGSGSSSGTAIGTRYVKSGIGLVNFRKSASLKAKLINQLKGGTAVTLLSQGPTWSRIRYNGRVGYMMTKYLVEKKK